MNPPPALRALITGASSGIGKATALAFAQAGIDVVLISRSPDRLEEVAQTARQAGVQAIAVSLDLSQVEQVRERIAAVTQEFGPIDILINNAGMGYTGSLGEVSLSDWQKVLDVNLTSVWQCIQGVLPGMRARQSGIIVNVVSVAGNQVFPNWGVYCVSKFGLMALSKTLALEERSHQIRVTAFCPGSVNTSIWDTETVQADFDRSAMLTPEIVAQSILHIVQLPPGAVIDELTLMPAVGTF